LSLTDRLETILLTVDSVIVAVSEVFTFFSILKLTDSVIVAVSFTDLLDSIDKLTLSDVDTTSLIVPPPLETAKRVSLTVILSETVLSIFNNLFTDSVMVEVSETLMLIGISKLYDSRVNTRSEYELRESFTVRLSLVLPLNSSVSANASLTVMDSDLLICDSN
jgi:hypothetical protein